MQNRNLPVHPACELFPALSDEQFQALKKDIEKNGVLHDIISWKGQLIDGRHRIQACEELGIEWQGKVVEMDESADPIVWAVSCNLHRRHLSQSQLSIVADKIRALHDAEAKARQKAGGGDKKSSTAKAAKKKTVKENLPEPKKPAAQARDKAAAMVGVSGKLADAARTVRKKGTPELAAAVESGDVSVTAAAELAKALPPAEQTAAVKSGTVKQEAAKVRADKKKPSSGAQAARVAAQEIEQTVKGFLRLKPAAEDVEPVMVALDNMQTLLEESMQ
jgi:ParB-like chromosome segregation protein Spo0J